MKYSVALYCPDKHICYNLHTLDENGVGGGIVARIRMTHAIAERGHEVTMYNHCPNDETINGVHYHHFSRLKQVESDIFIASTSGALDLGPLREVEIDANLKILMIHGVEPPVGFPLVEFDFVYALSNFVRGLVENRWGVDANKIFVTHRGVANDHYLNNQGSYRDPFAILYAGHPSKGLDAAISVLRLLRQRDQRYSLQIFGGHRLWGEAEQPIRVEPGVFDNGQVGQRELAHRMSICGFSLNLQAREEPFGMVVIEAMRAGCIVLASNIGAYPEIVQHGSNGFIIEGNYLDEATLSLAAQLILELTQNPDYCSTIRQNAISYPLDWATIAKAWEEHWDWVLQKTLTGSEDPGMGICDSCGGGWLSLADGQHCMGCGRYQKSLTQ